MSIVLIGYRGSGKTTVGKKLADRLWQTFVDTDDLVVREPRFRDLETEAMREVLLLQDHVIALGGGAVLREENRKLLADSGHKIVYLKCDPRVLAERIRSDPESGHTRPALTHLGGSEEEVREVLEQREPIYRAIKHAELDVTYLSPEDATVYIVRLL